MNNYQNDKQMAQLLPHVTFQKYLYVNKGVDRSGLLLYVNKAVDRGGLGVDRGGLLLYVNKAVGRPQSKNCFVWRSFITDHPPGLPRCLLRHAGWGASVITRILHGYPFTKPPFRSRVYVFPFQESYHPRTSPLNFRRSIFLIQNINFLKSVIAGKLLQRSFDIVTSDITTFKPRTLKALKGI